MSTNNLLQVEEKASLYSILLGAWCDGACELCTIIWLTICCIPVTLGQVSQLCPHVHIIRAQLCRGLRW
jgi:hypothetical protein